MFQRKDVRVRLQRGSGADEYPGIDDTFANSIHFGVVIRQLIQQIGSKACVTTIFVTHSYKGNVGLTQHAAYLVDRPIGVRE